MMLEENLGVVYKNSDKYKNQRRPQKKSQGLQDIEILLSTRW